MELELGFPVLGVKEDDAVAIETVAGSIHRHFVAEAILKLTGVFGGAGFAVLARFERFPNSARGGREGGKGVGDRAVVEFVHPMSAEGAEVHVAV